ncbi:MAG: signal peptidase I, partial [Dehalococcoidia bacterium]
MPRLSTGPWKFPIRVLKAVLPKGLLRKLMCLLAARRIVVRGLSMYPTLKPGEYLLFDRLAYRGSLPTQGDIVLADHPMHKRFPLIKRVVAVPGDTVESSGDRFLVNGEPYESPGLPDQGAVSTDSDDRWVLGVGEYFLAGDEPARSTDSRQLGPFHLSRIRARGWLVYWPLSHWRTLHP